MQTFLPYADFQKTAECLDYRRLGKQRVECLQILNAIFIPSYGWQNHPAVKMWRQDPGSLVLYGITICREWINRGYKDTCLDKIYGFTYKGGELSDPWWLGDPMFHESHRSNLLRKDPKFYGQYNWDVPDNLHYLWPSQKPFVFN